MPSSIDILRPSTHLSCYPQVPAENASNTRTPTRPRPPHLPPTYSAVPREGEQTVHCYDLPPHRRVVRLHRRRCLAWLPGLGRLRSPQPHDEDDVEGGELAVVYRFSSEMDDACPGKLVVSGWQLVLALLFALMVGIAISKPI
jgi:hypothetical protein